MTVCWFPLCNNPLLYNREALIHITNVAQKVQKILLKYQPFKSSLNIIEMTTKPMIIIIVPIITYVVGVILYKKFIINLYPSILLFISQASLHDKRTYNNINESYEHKVCTTKTYRLQAFHHRIIISFANMNKTYQ